MLDTSDLIAFGLRWLFLGAAMGFWAMMAIAAAGTISGLY